LSLHTSQKEFSERQARNRVRTREEARDVLEGILIKLKRFSSICFKIEDRCIYAIETRGDEDEKGYLLWIE